ncbi:MAG: sensor histidine kinase [Deltaproteobacteria bacterium]|uniref:Sensor histidine kinase n=1 Tax=Candidatus Desulfacyla euxinica TaxID=2841693 RepID=A0A8J6N301_9DELT|nr:sensor histidine kinase [Candidatus Desulfacyla euxinica]
MMTEKQFDKDVCGINFAVMFAYLDELGKDSSLICRRTGLSRNFLTSRREYVDLSVGTIIFDTVKEILDEKDPMVFFEIGKFSSRSSSLGILPDIVQFLGSVEESVRYIPRFNRKFSELFDMPVYNVKPNSAVTVINYKKRKYDGAWIFDQCAWNQGNIVGLPGFWDLPYMEIEEELCRFSLEEIIRDYSFMGHDFRYKNDRAALNGKEFAVPVAIGTEDFKRSNDKLDKLNPLGKKEEIHQVFTNKNYQVLDHHLHYERNDIPVGMLITRDTKISDMLTLREGQIFGAPYCRLNISWQGKKKISKSVMEFALERLSNSPTIIRALEEELDANINQKQDLITAQEGLKSAHHELKRYADNLEELVEERTIELRKTQEREQFLDQQLRIRDVLQTTEDVGAQILHENKNLLQPIGNILNRTTHLVRESKNVLGFLEQRPELKESGDGVDFEKLQYLVGSLESSLGTAELAYREIVGGYEDFRQVYNPREDGSNDIHRDLQASINLIIDRNYRSFIDVETHFGCDKVPKNYDSQQFNRGIFMNLLKNARDAIIEEKLRQAQGYRGNILVKTELVNKKTVVSVHDNGIGVPDGQEQTIFEKKYSTKESGTGLGLYTARFILDELSCGKIYCQKSDLAGYTTKMVVELELEKE